MMEKGGWWGGEGELKKRKREKKGEGEEEESASGELTPCAAVIHKGKKQNWLRPISFPLITKSKAEDKPLGLNQASSLLEIFFL